ncbi:magnesium-dependent phosphatase 1-like [Euwallacea fornicatus]|uniref:magnesium-dependent phosphatase 1-like n=1 Tax=Euwallacea fornicatus TaxID=995702 RepID=UPI00338F10E9
MAPPNIMSQQHSKHSTAKCLTRFKGDDLFNKEIALKKRGQCVPIVAETSRMKVDKLKIIVFDLDYTLWPFWIDTHVSPPFKKHNGGVVDTYGAAVKYYSEVPEVLKILTELGYEIGIASRTSEIRAANQLLDLFNWNKYIKYKQIFPGCKVTHFSNIKEQSKREYDEMLFFDDESRNIRDLNKVGVVSILVKNGVTMHAVEQGIKNYAKQRT